MDKVNKISSKIVSEAAEGTFDDPKVTCIEQHREKKRSRDAEARHISKTRVISEEEEPIKLAVEEARRKFELDKTVQEQKPNIQETDEAALSQSEEDDTPPHIFTEQIEVLETDLNDLQQRILERIQTTSDKEADALNVETSSQPEAFDPFTKASHQEEEATQTDTLTETHSEEYSNTEEKIETPLIYADKPKDESIKSLDRWLHKTPQENAGYSMTTIAAFCLILIALGGFVGGLLAAALISVRQDDQAKLAALDIEKEKAYSDYKSSLGDNSGSSIAGGGGNELSGSSSDDGNLAGSGGDGPKAAVMLAIPAVREAKSCDEQPKITLAGLRGGRTRIAISSQCHGGQTVKIRYAGVTFEKTLNETGQGFHILDCFAGDKEDITFVFQDKIRVVRKPVARDLNNLAKVAIIWRDDINLDLHAFEYAAKEKESGHIWERNPSNIEQALRRRNRTGLGRGFISSSSRGGAGRQNIEVYTFIRASSQKHGVVKLALNHQIIGGEQSSSICHRGGRKSVDYTTTTLMHNRNLKTGKAAVMVDFCKNGNVGHTLNSRAIQDLIIGR